jgi:hypothetical protein
VDLDVTECLKRALPFSPHTAPWMAAVKAALGTDDIRNITSEDGRYGRG